MTIRRAVSRAHVTSIAKLMSGDSSCIYSAWFRSWHERYRRAESDGSGLAEWNMRHTTMVHETVASLEVDGHEVSIEGQNWFETRSSQTGSIIIGQAGHHHGGPGRQGDGAGYKDRPAQGLRRAPGQALHAPAAPVGSSPLERSQDGWESAIRERSSRGPERRRHNA